MATDLAALCFRALLCGNGAYADTRLLDLHGPRRDVPALRDALCAGGAFRHDDIETHLDDDHLDLSRRLETFLRTTSADECLLVYYSGHGRIERDRFYLCARDTCLDQPLGSGIGNEFLRACMRSSPASFVILVLDCCYADRFKGDAPHADPDALFRRPGQRGTCVVMARPQRGALLPDAPPGGLSPFTELLTDELTSPSDGVGEHDVRTVADVVDAINRRAFRDGRDVLAHTSAEGTAAAPIALSTVPVISAAATLAPPDPVTSTTGPALVGVPPGAPEFLMSCHHVTNAEFATFLADDANAGWRPASYRDARAGQEGSAYLRSWDGDSPPPGTERHPVVGLPLAAVAQYLGWATRRTGRPLRLPHVREWTLASACGRPTVRFDREVDDGLVNCAQTGGRLAPVGEFGHNAYGIADLVGNVHDLCRTENGAVVLRGGGWRTPETRLGETLAADDQPPGRDDVGFRCVTRPINGVGQIDVSSSTGDDRSRA